MLTELLQDLLAEQAELARYVEKADLALAVPAEPWDVRDTVSHLVVGDEKAVLAAAHPQAFSAELPQVLADPRGFLDRWLLAGRGLSRSELTTRWYAGLLAVTAALEQVEPGTKIPWYGRR